MDDKKNKPSPAEKRREEMIKRLEESCKILGIELDESLLESNPSAANKRSDINRKAKLKLINENNEDAFGLPEIIVSKKDPGFPVKKLMFKNNKLVIEDNEDLKVSIVMSGGYKTNDNGKEYQVPEVNITIKREINYGNTPMSQIQQMMASGMRPVTKGFNSVLIKTGEKKTIYPNSFETALKYLRQNYNERIVKYFKFDIDFSSLMDTRLPVLFDRAIKGDKIIIGEVKL